MLVEKQATEIKGLNIFKKKKELMNLFFIAINVSEFIQLFQHKHSNEKCINTKIKANLYSDIFKKNPLKN